MEVDIEPLLDSTIHELIPLGVTECLTKALKSSGRSYNRGCFYSWLELELDWETQENEYFVTFKMVMWKNQLWFLELELWEDDVDLLNKFQWQHSWWNREDRPFQKHSTTYVNEVIRPQEMIKPLRELLQHEPNNS